ncbi:MAG TPA: cupredoxin domain-containing protein [Rubrivivax sp.]|nr:cupredoxin domain-containing protein [Burkholderiales bacterium]HNT39050.1 cupredoxin domain-containing protein [Rubrivivax sp.]
MRRREFARVLGFALVGQAAHPVARAVDAVVVEVRIAANRFEPAKVTVGTGATVRWINDERRTSHSVRFPAEGIESERMMPGEQWERRFERAGRYPYECGPHPEMKGEIVVGG